MANGHGGDRVPANPAPVSGPGALSQRTDGQAARYVSGMPYGDGQDFYDLQTSAPMAQSQSVAPRKRGGSRAASSGGDGGSVSMFAPTQRPNEPVTAGAPLGPGPGPVPSNGPASTVADSIAKFLPFDQTGSITRLYMIAKSRGW